MIKYSTENTMKEVEMIVWIKGEIVSPSPAKCPGCKGVIVGEANILLNISPPLLLEQGSISVQKILCDACKEKEK